MKQFLLSLTAVLFLISCQTTETPTPIKISIIKQYAIIRAFVNYYPMFEQNHFWGEM